MKNKIIPVLVALLLTGCTGQIAAPPLPISAQSLDVQTSIAETIPNEVIVKYRSGFNTQSTRTLPGAEVLDVFNTYEESTQLHRLPSNTQMDQALKTYASDPGVEFAIPNVRYQVQMSLTERVKKLFKSPTPSSTPNPISSKSPSKSQTLARTVMPDIPGLTAPSVKDSTSDASANGEQWYLSSLQMAQVWSDHGAGSSGITVAVLDTGVDYTHPALLGRIIKGPDYIDKDYDPKDEHGHGTHVAGIITAGTPDNQGFSGLAPNVRVLAIRVLDAKGSGSLFNIAKGIAYAANNGAKVINLSLGSPPGGGLMRSLANFLAGYAERKGALIIAAAGNAGSDIGYPAAASKFLAVGATNEQNYLASFSNRGAELDIVAPGVNILSTFPTYEVTANASGLPQNYASLNGTSMATPMVSALAAMLLSQDPYLKPAALRARLEATATDLGPLGRDNQFGHGVINPSKALEQD